jgi:S-adenosylmethionine/arginine decarboxylase-like enzyme
MKLTKYELLVSLIDCNIDFNKKNICNYINKLCKLIKMEKHGKTIIWEDSHNKIKEFRGGISAFQFIKTSSIVIHSFEKFNNCYVDIFSCKKFDFDKTKKFSKEFFKAKKIKIKKIIEDF